MRVISGLRKGHKLKVPKGMNVRPTEDKTKESLFNILGHINEDSIVLDAFGGSGSIGIEFLSRGAKICYFIDNSIDSINTINENLKHTKFLSQGVVTKSDTLAAIKRFGAQNLRFNYIYLDPPFRQKGLIENLFEVIKEEDILGNEGMIIVEHEKELDLEDNLSGFEKSDFRKYGSKSLTFYRRMD